MNIVPHEAIVTYSITGLTISEMKQLANLLGNLTSDQARAIADSDPEGSYDEPYDYVHEKLYWKLSDVLDKLNATP